MNTLLEEIYASLKNGRDLVVATIIDHHGSTPRTSGSKMIIFTDGSIYGTIGGGAVEGDVIRLAAQLSETEGAHIATYDLSDADQTAGMDLICGGWVQVLLEHVPVSDTTKELYRRAVEMIRNGNSFFWKARISRRNGHWQAERNIDSGGDADPGSGAAFLVRETGG
ncbi:MAG: XdhC family protein [Desulfofustis sp.]